MLGFDPAFGLCFVASSDSIPENLFEIDLVDHVQAIATFHLEQIRGNDCVRGSDLRGLRYDGRGIGEPDDARDTAHGLIDGSASGKTDRRDGEDYDCNYFEFHLDGTGNFRQLL